MLKPSVELPIVDVNFSKSADYQLEGDGETMVRQPSADSVNSSWEAEYIPLILSRQTGEAGAVVQVH